jgi:ankyrin repeat protein
MTLDYRPRTKEWYNDEELAARLRDGEIRWDSELPVGKLGKTRTVINIAARHGFLETLHEINKDPTADYSKYFSLFIAIKNRNFLAADILLANGANLEQEVMYNRETYPSMLFFFVEAEAREFNGQCRSEAISYLISRGADLTKTDKYGLTFGEKLASSSQLHDGSYTPNRSLHFEGVVDWLKAGLNKEVFTDKFGYSHSADFKTYLL